MIWIWFLRNEDYNFYINIYDESTPDTYTIVKFDKELISEIDNSIYKSIKDQAILDIFDSYKIDWFIYWEPSNERSWVRILEDDEMEAFYQFHNSILLPFEWESFIDTRKRLEEDENKSEENIKQLSYLYDIAWDYEQSIKLKESLWIEKINLTVKGKITNTSNIWSWILVEVLNYEDIFTYTNDKWEYELNFQTYPFTRLRLRASFDWLSDWFNWVYIVFDYDWQVKEDINFNLLKYNTKELITSIELKNWNTKTVKSTIWNSFVFKKWVILDENWDKFDWDFYVEIYEFNKTTSWMDNYLTLDNFDLIYWYVWDMMITSWMTYLLLKDLEWNELFISKENPIITRQTIDINYLMNRGTEIAWISNLTEEQLDLIYEKSKEEWYPIDTKFLAERGITWFSPWWVLNINKGIWENNWFKLLDKSWLKESLYYNID